MTPRPGGNLIVYADGAVNPRSAGVGVVGVDEDGAVTLVLNRTLPAMTSGEAEYSALLLALEIAAARAIEQVEIRLDSEVVVNQMTGRYAVNSARLKRLHQQACALARTIPRLHYTYIPREYNALADALASEAAAGRAWRSAASS